MTTSNAQAGPSDAEIASVPWYHTIRLPDGRLTPGYFDVQAVADRSGLPDSLEGKRCLDVGTCDGFWAFEMERRGAAEVVGDRPRRHDAPRLAGAGAARRPRRRLRALRRRRSR